MRKENPVRYSSAVGEVWIMMTFKAKYCHPIFDFEEIRLYASKLFEEAFEKYGIRWKKKSFDSNHVHTLLDLGIMSKPEVAKKVKGYTARKLFQRFRWLKKRYFWGSGLWNPATDGRTGDILFYEKYLDKQKYGMANQTRLTAFA